MTTLPMIGRRIRLLAMPEDPAPLPIGSEGTVRAIWTFDDGWAQIDVQWDNGRMLMLSVPPDRFEIL